MTSEVFELVGLIPAAGHARRLGAHAGSKELLPVPDASSANARQPVAGGLLRQMTGADCTRVFFITRADKADIAQAFGSGASYQVPIGYLMIEDSWGPPFTLATAFKFAPGAGFAFGFPDIMIEPPDALAKLSARLRAGSADLIIGTFPARDGQGVDLVKSDGNGIVTAIIPKEQNPSWPTNGQTWLMAVWRPSFTAFFENTLELLREQMRREQIEREKHHCQSAAPPDLPTGEVFARALQAGLTVESVYFERGRFLDIGTPDRLAMAADFYQSER